MAHVHAEPLNVLAHSRQLILVKATHWTSTTATLQRYTRTSTCHSWSPTGSEIPVSLGRNGLGWGRGLHEFSESDITHIKQEGDGKTPAGIFRLSRIFSVASPDHLLKFPFLGVTSSMECIDDPASRDYNRIVDRKQIADPDWKSSEFMLRSDDQYKWGIVIDHNADSTVTNAGSCLFIHIWKSSQIPTAGCTAMAEENIKTLIDWLDSNAKPILVQLPEVEYQRLRTPWALP